MNQMKLLLILLLAIAPASAAVVTDANGCMPFHQYSMLMKRVYFTWCPPVSRRY